MLLAVDRALEAVDDEMLAALSADERATLNELLARAAPRTASATARVRRGSGRGVRPAGLLSGSLPAAAVDDLVERAPVGPPERARAAGRPGSRARAARRRSDPRGSRAASARDPDPRRRRGCCRCRGRPRRAPCSSSPGRGRTAASAAGSSSSASTGPRQTITAAAPATCAAPRQTFASSGSCARSVTSTKSHGCQLRDDGARLPASRIRSRSASAIGRSANTRTLRRALIASQVSIRVTIALACALPGCPHG